MTTPLTAADLPGIQSLRAEVRVLMVGSMGMSISMFTQLDNASIFDERGEYLGTPWGRVNHAAACDARSWEREPKGHAHVVWQNNGTLLKCCVRRDPEESLLRPFRERHRLYYELMLITRAADEQPEYDLNNHHRLIAVRWPDHTARSDYGFDEGLTFALGQPDSQVAKAEIERRLVALDERPSDAWTYFDAEARAIEVEMDAFRSVWRRRFAECARLPVLIIGHTPSSRRLPS